MRRAPMRGPVRPAFLECTACAKHHDVRLINLCDCGGPLFARYEWSGLRKEDLQPTSQVPLNPFDFADPPRPPGRCRFGLPK